MPMFQAVQRAMVAAYVRVTTLEPERGDVPGWVLITVMTAALVSALLLVSRGLLTNVFSRAVKSVG